MEVDPAQIPLPEDNVDPPQPHHPREVKLPPFWTSRPRAWFTYVESRFRLRGIEDEQTRFDHVLAALPGEMVAQVLDIVDAVPEDNPYTFFKDQLLESHQLSDYEKFDMLVKMEPMGGRKPSQLLHAMLEYCPAGMERHLSFHYFFMQRLPQALRTQLGEVQPGDPRALAMRADRLWSVHGASSNTIAAAVEPPADPTAAVAAVKTAPSRGKNKGGYSRGGQQRGRGASRTPAAVGGQAADPTPSDLARASSGLCFFHWSYAEKATKCQPPCTWGN